MSFDPTLTKDPVQAAALLADMEHKNEHECSYPTCHEPRQVVTGTGRPSAYCSHPKHNAVNAHRARQQLATAASLDTRHGKQNLSPLSVTVTTESLRGSVLNRILLLQGDLERYVTALTEMSDPDVSAAQLKAILDQANAEVAKAQQNVSNEQALRLKAEADVQIAREAAQVEREAAEQAIARMEEVETQAQHQRENAERLVKDIQKERDTTVQEIKVRMEHDLTQAQAATARAQEEARQANAATLEARTQATTAERLVKESQTTLERERTEVDRLRKELAQTTTEMRKQAEADRTEMNTVLARERSEVQRLREEVTATRKQADNAVLQATNRAEKLALINDELRTQLVQVQTRGKELPEQ